MGWMRNTVSWAAQRALKYAGVPVRDPALAVLLGAGNDSTAGEDVTEDTALNYSAVWAGVNLLASSKAQLPFKVTLTGEFVDAVDTPAYHILVEEPNPEMTPFTWAEVIQGHAVSWGNGYGEIVRDSSDVPLAIYPITPDRVQEKRRSGSRSQLYYEVANNDGGAPQEIEAHNMFHIPGFGFDGTRGYSVVQRMREAIGMGLATERHGAALFGNGATPGGVLQHPGELSDQAQRRLVNTFESRHRGGRNAHKVAVLEEGMTWQATGLKPEDSQFLATRQFQVIEIARFLNVPPHLLRDLLHATFSNIEHQSLEFLIYSLGPWLTRWCQEARRKLLPRSDWRKISIDHNVDHFLRSDIKTRYEAWRIGREGGWLSANTILAKEGMAASTLQGADSLLVPMNMTMLQGAENSPPPTNVQSTAMSGGQITAMLSVMVALKEGTISPGGAQQLMTLAFPGMDQTAISQMVAKGGAL